MEKTTLNININKDESGLNDFLYCWSKFETRPNKLVLYNTYSTKHFNDIISSIVVDKNVFTEIIPSDENFIINDKMFVKINDFIYLSYVIIDRNLENSIINEITFFYSEYDNGIKKIQEIIDSLCDCLVDFCEEQSNNLNTISISQHGIEIEPLDLSKIDIESIDSYYSNKTFKEINKLIKKIKKSDKGLSILYGDRGTGKTSMVNYISTKLDRIVIFIPNNMMDSTINNPEFRKFLKKYYKPIIIIDDCEVLFNDLYTKSNIYTNNLLQIVDGFLSDSIEVNIITIFNVNNESEIDHSFLECNSLIDIVKFENLSVDESNELAKHIGNKKNHKTKMKLIDIIKDKKETSEITIGLN